MRNVMSDSFQVNIAVEDDPSEATVNEIERRHLEALRQNVPRAMGSR
jgi:hypothetical protein